MHLKSFSILKQMKGMAKPFSLGINLPYSRAQIGSFNSTLTLSFMLKTL